MPLSFLMCLSQVHTHGSFFHTLPQRIVPIQILLIRQSQVYMTILIIPKIFCRKLLQNVRVLLRYVFSNSTYLPVVYPLVFFSLESLQSKIGGPVSSGTILNNALKYNKFGLSGNFRKNI